MDYFDRENERGGGLYAWEGKNLYLGLVKLSMDKDSI